MTWAAPKDLLFAYRNANAYEWTRYLKWYEERGYPYMAALRKELAREDRKRDTDSAVRTGNSAVRGRESGASIEGRRVGFVRDDEGIRGCEIGDPQDGLAIHDAKASGRDGLADLAHGVGE